MATFIVTTGDDSVADDGQLSLREAIAAAANSAGADTIRFDASVSQVVLEDGLRVGGGGALTIDGANALGSRVEIDGGFRGNPFEAGYTILEVGQNANLTLRNLGFVNGFERTADGADATWGEDGLDGNDGEGAGAPGSTGNSGTSALNNARDVTGTAVGGIDNAGSLVLEGVSFTSMNAFGGEGGAGGRGGDGGHGGSGVGATEGPGGFGGSGGHAGDGSHGRNGGDAAGTLYNTGTLVLRDVTFSSVNTFAGNGGRGGDTGVAGAGGKGGSGDPGGFGGNGGNGARSGRGGDGGDAAALILNRGTVVFEGAVAAAISANASAGGAGGSGTAFGPGPGGKGWDAAGNPVTAPSGSPGIKATDGGTEGTEGSFLGTTGPATVASTFVIHASAAEVAELGAEAARSVTFAVERLGSASAAASVDWDLLAGRGIRAKDFVGGLPEGGTLEFAAGQRLITFTLTLRHNAQVEGTETFRIALDAVTAQTAVGWAGQAVVRVADGEIPGTGEADRLEGRPGADVLLGLAGDDTLFGRGGPDRLLGGAGSDRLFGGSGNDRFVFQTGDLADTRARADVILDFQRNDGFGQGDLIDLTGFDADRTKAGLQHFTFSTSSSFNQPGQMRLVEQNGDTIVYLNTDTDQDAEAVIVVRGVTDLFLFDFDLS